MQKTAGSAIDKIYLKDSYEIKQIRIMNVQRYTNNYDICYI